MEKMARSDSSGLDGLPRNPTGFKGLQAEVSEVNSIALCRQSPDSSALGLAILYAFGH